MTNFAATRQIIQVKSSGFVMNRSNLSYVKACAGHSMKFLIALGAKVVHTLDYWCERGGGGVRCACPVQGTTGYFIKFKMLGIFIWVGHHRQFSLIVFSILRKRSMVIRPINVLLYCSNSLPVSKHTLTLAVKYETLFRVESPDVQTT